MGEENNPLSSALQEKLNEKKDTFEKQPWEEFPISAGFTVNAASGEEVNAEASTVTAVDKAGAEDTSILDLSSKTVGDAATQLKIRVLGGEESKSPYKITFKIVTTLNNKYEVNCFMGVKDT